LVKEAKHAGKLSQDYSIPDHARNNRPERLKKVLDPHRERGLFPKFPFGTDLTGEEVVLGKALEFLKQAVERKKLRMPRFAEIRKTINVPSNARLYLERMELDRPHTIKERLLKRALVYALASVEAI
jgi:hypothetical protein